MSNIVNKPATKKSGLYKDGYLHKDGGIQVVVDGVKKVEVEVKEYHLCKGVFDSDKIYDFKDNTNLEILDEIFRDSNCIFEQGKAQSGDFIICRPVVLDKKKITIKGTAKDVINKLQAEKSCRVTADAADQYKNRTGGNISAEDYSKLICVHNIQIEYLIFADEMGGLPMPSLAIINPERDYVKYGDITLIAPKSLYDPRLSNKNLVFDRDVYSPRFPNIYYRINNSLLFKRTKVFEEFSKKLDTISMKICLNGISDLERAIDDGKKSLSDVFDSLKDNYGFLFFYAKYKNIDLNFKETNVLMPKLLGTSIPTEKQINFFKKYIKENYPIFIGKSTYSYSDEEFVEQLTKFYKDINTDLDLLTVKYGFEDSENKKTTKLLKDIGKTGIDNNVGKDGIHFSIGLDLIKDIDNLLNDKKEINKIVLREYFDESKFYENNLVGIKELVIELTKDVYIDSYFYNNGKKIKLTLKNVYKFMSSQDVKSGEKYFYGLGNASALAAKQYKTLNDIKNDFNKIVSKEDFEKYRDYQQSEYNKIYDLRKYYRYDVNYASNDFITALGVIASRNKPDYKTVTSILDKYALDIPESYYEDILTFCSVLRNAPTEYFEVKLRKMVDLGEFESAIIPSDYIEGIEILKNNGIKNIYTYDYTDDKVNTLKNRKDALYKAISDNSDLVFEQGGSMESEEVNYIIKTDTISLPSFINKNAINNKDVEEVVSLPKSTSDYKEVIIVLKKKFKENNIKIKDIDYVIVNDNNNFIKNILRFHNISYK